MSALVRLAKPEDLEGVLVLYKELRPYDPELTPQLARDTFLDLLRRDDIALVVYEFDEALTATCMLALVPNLASGTRPFGVIEHVVTLPEFRRRGHGRIVLQHALNLAWSKRCCKVVLLSGEHRVQAHKLYESVGFVGGVERGFVARPPSAA
jgi:GNAT superfamily N-acetyltransferase